MRNGFLELIEIRPSRSVMVRAFAALALPLAVAAIMAADLPPGWRVPALACVGLCGGAGLIAEGARGIRSALLGQDGNWTLVPQEGRRLAAMLVRAWGASLGPVMALEWRCADGRICRAWITRRDACGPHWRRLRARLRLT